MLNHKKNHGMKNKLLLLFFTVLVGSCKSPTSFYEIPIIDKILIINTPTFSDYAYISIYTKKSHIIKDVADFKIIRGATTDISLIFNIHKNDTIYYSDRWNDVTLLSKKYTKRLNGMMIDFILKKLTPIYTI